MPELQNSLLVVRATVACANDEVRCGIALGVSTSILPKRRTISGFSRKRSHFCCGRESMANVQGESLKVMLPSSTVLNSRLLRRTQLKCAFKSTLELDMNNALYSLEESISAIRAFNEMLAAAAYQGDSLKEISGGMHLLLGTQVDILAAADEALRNQISDLKKQVQEMSINLIPNSDQRNASHADIRQMRATFIQDKIGEGYDAGELAQALNLKKETVEKVIRKLLGSDTPNTASHLLKSANE